MTLRAWWSRVRGSLRRDGALDREMDREMEFHVEMATQRNVERGMPPETARRQANTVKHRRVGDATVTLRFWRDPDGASRHEIVEQAGTLRIVTQPPLDALNAGIVDRLGALVTGMLPFLSSEREYSATVRSGAHRTFRSFRYCSSRGKLRNGSFAGSPEGWEGRRLN